MTGVTLNLPTELVFLLWRAYSRSQECFNHDGKQDECGLCDGCIAYDSGEFEHDADCPAPQIERLRVEPSAHVRSLLTRDGDETP